MGAVAALLVLCLVCLPVALVAAYYLLSAALIAALWLVAGVCKVLAVLLRSLGL